MIWGWKMRDVLLLSVLQRGRSFLFSPRGSQFQIPNGNWKLTRRLKDLSNRSWLELDMSGTLPTSFLDVALFVSSYVYDEFS